MNKKLVMISAVIAPICSLMILTAFFSGNPNEQLLVTDNEKNTVSIFQKNVHSVVNISSIRAARSLWGFRTYEIPSGMGSGFVWDKDGHIVTNAHVVSNGDLFTVSFHNDKKQYEARLVGVYPARDIAVLKLKDVPKKLHPIVPGTSNSLYVGQKAVAIGNPFQLDNTLTEGVVSALNREIEGFGGVKIYGMIQTDASINPGNSGGPLLNSQGQLIGMNTLIYSRSGASAGVGFAVPVNTIKQFVPQLIKHGKVVRPGIGVQLLPGHIQKQFGLEKGLIILKVQKHGPAFKVGLQGITRDRYGRYHLGDIIMKINDEEINSYDELYNLLDKYKIGDIVEITYFRDDKLKKVKVKLTTLK